MMNIPDASPTDIAIDELGKGFKLEIDRSSQSKYAQARPNMPVRYVGYAKYSSAERTPLATIDLDEKLSSFGSSEGRQPLISFIPPDGGMFIWVTVYARNHKRFNAHASPADRRLATRDLMNELWEELAQNKLLIAPGWMFAGDGLRAGAPDEPAPTEEQVQVESMLRDAGVIADQENGVGHFRLAFSFDTHDKLREGVAIFAKVTTKFFQ